MRVKRVRDNPREQSQYLTCICISLVGWNYVTVLCHETWQEGSLWKIRSVSCLQPNKRKRNVRYSYLLAYIIIYSYVYSFTCFVVVTVLGFHVRHYSCFPPLSFRNSFIIPNRFLSLCLFPIIRPSITSLLCLFPIIRPSITSLSRLSSLSIWQIQFFFLLQIKSIRLLFSCLSCTSFLGRGTLDLEWSSSWVSPLS